MDFGNASDVFTDTRWLHRLHEDQPYTTPLTCKKDFYNCYAPNATVHPEQRVATPYALGDDHILLFKEILRRFGIRDGSWKVLTADFRVRGGPLQKIVTPLRDQARLAKYLRIVRTAIIAKHEDRDCAYCRSQQTKVAYKTAGGSKAGDIAEQYDIIRKIPAASWSKGNRPASLGG